MTESGPIAVARNLLAREKQKDYRNTVVLQIVILTVQLLTEDLLKLAGWAPPMSLLRPLFYGLSGLYLIFLWDLFRNFQPPKWLMRTCQTGVLLAFACLVVLDVFLGVGEVNGRGFRLASHLTVLAVQVVVVLAALRDLFQGPREAADKLWGSACIYFMTGFIFAGFYYSVFLVNPLAFGTKLSPDAWGFFEALYISLTAMVGMDNPYDQSIRLIRNTVLLEGTWGQLYLVLLIGRLLAPESEESLSVPKQDDTDS